MAAAAYKLDDYRPYLFKTNDYGETWTQINNGIPDNDFTRVIREDPARRGLLYAGTETGIYVSFDDGDNWQSLQLNLPVAPIHDFVIKDNDLVVATHGRAFWILDDLTPLHQISDESSQAPGYPLQTKRGVQVPHVAAPATRRLVGGGHELRPRRWTGHLLLVHGKRRRGQHREADVHGRGPEPS